MTGFLELISKDILHQHPDLRNVGIILPSRRAAVFLKKELSKQISKPVWSPYISTIEDFLLETLEWEQADQPGLLFQLYQSYLETYSGEPESFADFSQWAHLMLADFNEIDRYMVNAREIFSYLADVERIKKWDLQPGEELSEFVKNYLKLWENLPALYNHFTKKLKTEKNVYQGMAYRQMADEVRAHVPALQKRFDRLFFVGFNALNTSEEQILTTLYREGLARFYWDVDEYYFKDSRQEAGSFLRSSKLVQELIEKNDFQWEHNYLGSIPKHIRIINITGNHLQAVAANASVLDFKERELENVAVVLADEELLPVFLNNLPEEVPALNVTMGLPLDRTPVSGFFGLLLEMHQENEHTSRKDANQNPSYHFQKWDDLLSHQLFKLWLGDAALCEKLRQEIRERNRIFISVDELNDWSENKIPDAVTAFFNSRFQKDLPEFWKFLARIAEWINELHQQKDVLLQSLFGFFKLFNRLAMLMEEYPFVKDLKTAQRFYRDVLRSETLDVFGEPLSGLQVMGMLETRTLDFKNLVITSLNEDILPKGRSENSLIPFDIKREFGLPTYLEKDAVFAYHFYRLIQRAENVDIIYNSLSEGMGSGEPSRFIKQLRYELNKVNANVKFDEVNPAYHVDTEDTIEVVVQKTTSVMARLYEMADRGFSASALIDYINDPLEFYKKRVLKLEESEEVEEVAGYNTQGNVVHKILEDFYKKGDTAKPVLKPDDPVFAQSRETIRQLVVEHLKSEANLRDTDKGKNLLIREILTGMVANFLQTEKDKLKEIRQRGQVLSLLGLEAEYHGTLRLTNGDEVRLKGFIDRVDRVGDEVRVIDYKTGKVENTNLTLKDMGELRQPEVKNKSLQLMLYAWLFFKNNADYDDVAPAIISLRNARAWLMPLKWNGQKSIQRELMEEFEVFLKALFEEIFDPETPFSKKPLTLVSDE